MKPSFPTHAPKPRTHLLGLFLLALLTLGLNRSGIDQAITGLFFDLSSNSFPLRENWAMSSLLHTGLRNLSALLWLICLCLMIYLGVRRKWGRKALSKRSELTLKTLGWVTPTLLMAALLTALIKSQSLHSCPWDLKEFGGQADFVYLLQSVLTGQDTGPGKCFPSGHASSGWMWLTLLFVPGYLRSQGGQSPRVWTRLAWFAVLSMGVVTSLAQVVRGAHFISHTTATAAICWAVAWLGAVLAHQLYKPIEPD